MSAYVRMAVEAAKEARYEKSRFEYCEVCQARIRTMCWLGTGVCGETHRKVRDKESLIPHTPKRKRRKA